MYQRYEDDDMLLVVGMVNKMTLFKHKGDEDVFSCLNKKVLMKGKVLIIALKLKEENKKVSWDFK